MNDQFVKVHDQLPVFKIDLGNQMILYTPGYFFKTNNVPLHELKLIFKNPDLGGENVSRDEILNLLNRSRDALNRWESQKNEPFEPECLTIHAGSDCNLNCTYCYAKIDITGNDKIVGFPSLNSIQTLSRFIADKAKGKFTVVYHGSGEPSFHWKQLVDSYNSISIIAKKNNLQIFSYISTNGCLTEAQIDWLVENMSLIGISCDGTPAIQKKQRSRDAVKYLLIEEVCKRITDKGGEFDIRTTITKETMALLPEIASYLIISCKAKNIRIEPVYLAGENALLEKDADEFFRQFNIARELATQYHVTLGYAGLRLDELHGTYCDVLRNNLRLTAGNVTRNCFCFMTDDENYITGRCSEDPTGYLISHEIQNLKSKALQIPAECHDCINIFHCSRGCPEFCLFDNEDHISGKLNPFRCRFHQLLAVHRIKESAMNQSTPN